MIYHKNAGNGVAKTDDDAFGFVLIVSEQVETCCYFLHACETGVQFRASSWIMRSQDLCWLYELLYPVLLIFALEKSDELNQSVQLSVEYRYVCAVLKVCSHVI